jgi:hypothetical protein
MYGDDQWGEHMASLTIEHFSRPGPLIPNRIMVDAWQGKGKASKCLPKWGLGFPRPAPYKWKVDRVPAPTRTSIPIFFFPAQISAQAMRNFGA